uniref:Uncharacterized protein n=1 Tax=Nothobranchius kuhntae TaxID=321403 RepID=A0A1A8HYQ8_NOTKU
MENSTVERDRHPVDFCGRRRGVCSTAKRRAIDTVTVGSLTELIAIEANFVPCSLHCIGDVVTMTRLGLTGSMNGPVANVTMDHLMQRPVIKSSWCHDLHHTRLFNESCSTDAG